MFKIAAVIWIMLGTTLAGLAMVVIVSVPGLAEQSAKLIPYFCGGAFLLGIPVSMLVARRIQAQTHA